MKPLLSALALCLAGCATHQFAQTDGKWTTRTGQLHYKEGERSIVGELVVSTNGKNAKLDFSKGAGLSLLSMQRDATHARFEGPLARLAHTVKLVPPPAGRDAAWLSVVDQAAGKSQFRLAEGDLQLSVQLAPAR